MDHGKTRRRRLRIALVAVALLVGGLMVAVAADGGHSAQSRPATSKLTGPPGPEGVPLQVGEVLAPMSTATGQAVAKVACDHSEQAAYHIHTHLSVYVNGLLRPIPAGVGVVRPVAEQTPSGAFYAATSCYYWLHTLAQDGIIHVESPSMRPYTLGQFFAIWGQPLTSNPGGASRRHSRRVREWPALLR